METLLARAGSVSTTTLTRTETKATSERIDLTPSCYSGVGSEHVGDGPSSPGAVGRCPTARAVEVTPCIRTFSFMDAWLLCSSLGREDQGHIHDLQGREIFD